MLVSVLAETHMELMICAESIDECTTTAAAVPAAAVARGRARARARSTGA